MSQGIMRKGKNTPKSKSGRGDAANLPDPSIGPDPDPESSGPDASVGPDGASNSPDPNVGPDPEKSEPDPSVGPDPVISYRERLKNWRELSKRVTAEPKQSALRVQAIMELKSLGHYDEGIVHALAATKLRPKDSYIQLMLAELYGEIGETQKAAAVLKKAVSISPEAHVFVQAFDYYRQFHLYPEAARCAKDGAKKFSQDLGLALRNAQILLWYNKPAEALKEARRAVKIDSTSAVAHRHEGAALFLREEIAAAKKAFDAALARDKNDLEALSWRADCHRRLGNIEACFADVAAAKKLAPRPIGAIFAKALVHLERGETLPMDEEPIVHTNVPIPLFDLKNNFKGDAKMWIKGITHMFGLMAGNRASHGTFLVDGRLRRHIHYFPRDPLVEAQSRLRFGDYQRVLKQFAAFMKEEPGEAYLHSHRGEISMWTGFFADADKDFAAAREFNKGLLWPRVGRVGVWVFTDRVEEAREELKELVRKGGSASILLPWRIEVHRRSGEWQEVLKIIDRDFSEPLPLRPHVWLSKATAHQGLKQMVEAREIFDGLMRHLPDFMEDACERVGVAFEKKKRSDSEIGKIIAAALVSMRGNRSRWFYTYFTKDEEFRYARIYGLKREQVPFQLAGQPWLFADT
jgi:tetratricopeptide (TPR) repeat protein